MVGFLVGVVVGLLVGWSVDEPAFVTDLKSRIGF